MKPANPRVIPPARPSEELDRILQLLEEIHEKLDALAWGADIPHEVAQQIAKLDERLHWRYLDIFERRLTRLEENLKGASIGDSRERSRTNVQ